MEHDNDATDDGARSPKHGFVAYTPDHQALRWAINIPTAILILVFGDHLGLYYVGPLASFAIGVAMTWLVAFRLGGTAAAVVAVILLGICTETIRASSQLLPSSYSVGFMMSATWCFVYARDSQRPRLMVVFGTVLLFCAYGAKSTNLFFVPGLLLWLALSRQQRLIGLLCGVFVALVILESAVVDAYSEGRFTFGRIEALLTESVESMRAREQASDLTDLLRRWLVPRGPTRLVFFGFFAIVLAAWPLPRLRRRGPLMILLLGLSFALLTTFSVISLNPLLPAQPIGTVRFLVVLLPYAALMVGLFHANYVYPVFRWAWLKGVGHAPHWNPILACAVALGVVATVNLTDHRPPGYGIMSADSHFRTVQRIIDGGCPIYFDQHRAARAVREVECERNLVGN